MISSKIPEEIEKPGSKKAANVVWIMNPAVPDSREWRGPGPMITGHPLNDLRPLGRKLRGKRSGIAISESTYKERVGVPTIEEWKGLPATFKDGKLIIDGFQVMRDDENSYMSHLVRIAAAGGRNTLEVGLGMGIATKMLLKRNDVAHHTVIELNADVIAKMRKDPVISKAEAEGRLTILEGDWKKVVRKLIRAGRKFDGILFDTYPLRRGNRIELHANHYPFFPYAKKLLSEKGIFTYYSDEPQYFSAAHAIKLSKAGFTGIHGYAVPSNFESDRDRNDYWHHPTILAPIITHASDYGNTNLQSLLRSTYVSLVRKQLHINESHYDGLVAKLDAARKARRVGAVRALEKELADVRELGIKNCISELRYNLIHPDTKFRFYYAALPKPEVR